MRQYRRSTLMYAVIAILAVILLLTACQTTPEKEREKATTPTTNTQTSYSDDYYTRCPKLQRLDSREEADLLNWIDLFLDNYKLCSTRVDNHVDNMQKLFPRPVMSPASAASTTSR